MILVFPRRWQISSLRIVHPPVLDRIWALRGSTGTGTGTSSRRSGSSRLDDLQVVIRIAIPITTTTTTITGCRCGCRCLALQGPVLDGGAEGLDQLHCHDIDARFGVPSEWDGKAVGDTAEGVHGSGSTAPSVVLPGRFL